MPSFTTSKLPKPKSWDEFEDIVSDILKEDFKDPLLSRFGRLGQKQNGIDIYASLRKSNGEKCGIQCKNEEITSMKKIKDSISEAEKFSPPLNMFIFATSASRDVKIQKEVWEISDARKKKDLFEVKILFWEDLTLMISGYYFLMQKHFSQFISNPSSLEQINRIILNSTFEDWLFDDIKGIYTYKHDVNITIKRGPFKEREEFQEKWIKSFGLHKGYTSHHEVYHGNSFIQRFWVVAVDGYRAYIPYPDQDMNISTLQYKFGRIVNDSYKYSDQFGVNWFDSYLNRCKISVNEGE